MQRGSLAEQLARATGHDVPVESEQKQDFSAFLPKEPEREILLEDGIVEIGVPQSAKLIDATEVIGVKYLQFGLKVNGGVINVHIHGNDLKQMRGTTVHGELKIWRKTVGSGRKFLNIDITVKNTEPTYTLRVISGNYVGRDEEEGTMVYQTHRPLKGAIIVTPLPSQ